MRSFAIKLNFFGAIIFSILAFSFFSSAIGATGDVELTDQYKNSNPTTNSGYQIVPHCADRPGQECKWEDLLVLVRNIMGLLLYLSATIAVISFMYAGFLYLTAFGDMGKVEQAHGIFSKVIIGFLFVFLGWLIVATILKTMGVVPDFSILDFNSVTEVKPSN